MTEIPATLSKFLQDAFVLARYAGPQDGRPEGRAWERATSGLLIRAGLGRRQHAGTIGLFGAGSASGAAHELDGAAHGPDVGIWLECKARAALDKSDVAVLAFKCQDLYQQCIREDPSAAIGGRWWPVLVSSEPTSESVQRSCVALGVTLCDPVRMPLPVLLRMAGQPIADRWLDERSLSELVRLAEPLARPLQERFRFDAARFELRWSLDGPSASEIGDLLFLQEQLTDDLLDVFDLESPHHFRRRAEQLGDRLVAARL